MQFQVDGFSLIGRTQLSVDDQIVYTSEIDPTTGQAIEKPMIVTGQLTDELGSNLSNRAIRITYEMVDDSLGVISCIPGTTDANGFFEIVCPLSGVTAGQARVNIQFNSYENNDRYRYSNSSSTRIFPVFLQLDNADYGSRSIQIRCRHIHIPERLRVPCRVLERVIPR